MKEQGVSSHRQLSEDVKTPAEVGVSYRHSINANAADVNYEDLGYVQLSDPSKKVRSHATSVLDTLKVLGMSAEAFRQAGVTEQSLQELFTKELSCSRYFRWAFVDNFVEKMLQGLILNKQDVSQEEINFCKSMIRQMPSGRSLLLHQTCGLRKVYATRGFVLTTEMVLIEAVKAFITVALSYRLYNWFTIDDQNFLEFTTLFDDNTKKGASSLARLLLSRFDPKSIYLLLASPGIVGVLKGLWDTRKSQPLTEHAITQLQEAVDYHTNALLKRSYVFGDVLRQLIPMPGLSSVSERVQKAEQQIRWDGRITHEQRASLFSHIERLALHGSGMSQITAIQSLGKIVHSLSIKDFRQLQQAGYPQETLVQILGIKIQALRDLKMLSNRAHAHVQPEEVHQNPTPALNQSLVSTLYANYLLWWLGMGNFKHSPLFWAFKLGKLVLEGLFLNGLVQSILDVVNCPDKQGFDMRTGEYPVWANDLTLDCFEQFVRQFRLVSEEELFPPFLEQLSNFDLRAVESIDLSSKVLTSNETREILDILNKRAFIITKLDLSINEINDTMGLSFPNNLQALDLSGNHISDVGALGLKLPDTLQALDLSDNNISDVGALGLKLPDNLQDLYLSGNNISDVGALGLKLPDTLQALDLSDNNISDVGALGLKLPDTLQYLYLSSNNISDAGALGLKLPDNLQGLYLSSSNISDVGALGLKLPDNLQVLDLGSNPISDAGALGLKLPDDLQILFLSGNHISDAGALGLKLPDNLQLLFLSANHISDAGALGLKLPDNLQGLDLGGNNISDAGALGLKLPDNLQLLFLGGNHISDAGALGLKLPDNLQTLYLGGNPISDVGALGLKLPDNLQTLYLIDNNINDVGALGLKLPDTLQTLYLGSNNISDVGALGLKLPDNLQTLDLSDNNINDVGAAGLKLPANLQDLDLSDNNIGDEGVKAILKRIPQTKLTFINLDGNPYNSTAISPDRVIQQGILLRNCRSKLCYADTSLSQDEYQTSGATRAQPPLFFSWLKKPFDKLSEYVSDCMSTAIDNFGIRLGKVLSQSPSYFPNIRSPEINDWQPSSSGSIMLHQFKASGSNTLFLPAPQTAILPSFRPVA